MSILQNIAALAFLLGSLSAFLEGEDNLLINNTTDIGQNRTNASVLLQSALLVGEDNHLGNNAADIGQNRTNASVLLQSALLVGEDNHLGNNAADIGQNGTNASVLLQKETVTGDPVITVNATLLMNPEETGAYLEGDIMLADGVSSAEVNNDSTLWTSVNIPYAIEGNYSAQQLRMISQAIYTIQLWIGFRFIPRLDQTDYIAIRNDKGAGCSSYVGRIGGRQMVNLEAPLCFVKIGTILHELLHVIGLSHEHNSPIRDQYITINESNIIEDKKIFFEKYSNPNQKKFLEYAYDSIMHFSEYAASKNGEKTIESKVDGVKIGQREGLTIRDLKAIASLYDYDYSNTWLHNVSTNNAPVLSNFNMGIISLLSEEFIETIRRDQNMWNLISLAPTPPEKFSAFGNFINIHDYDFLHPVLQLL